MAYGYTAIGGIEFEEIEGSPTLDVGENGSTAQRRFRLTDWSRCLDFILELRGIFITVAGQIQATPPLRFPGFGMSFNNFVCVRARVERGIGAVNGSSVTSLISGTNTYGGGAFIVADYRTTAAEFGSSTLPQGTYVTYESAGQASITSVAGRGWKWVSDNQPLPQDVPFGLRTPVANHIFTWHNVATIPESTKTKLGFVNNSDFGSIKSNAGLYAAYQLRPVVQLKNGAWLYDIAYTIEERVGKDRSNNDLTWQCLYRCDADKTTGFEGVVAKQGGGKPFSEFDMTKLFKYDT